MKPLPKLAQSRCLALVAGALTAHAQPAWGLGGLGGDATSVFAFPVNQAIPDGNFSGLANTQTLPASFAPIQSVAVTVVLTPLGEGGFMGDLYATLAHDGGGYSVLLNRPGKQPGRAFGYSDDVTVSVTLADDAAADIHQYRLTLTGNEFLPLTSALTGRWLPDGRNTDPLLVSTSDLRDATLASFNGANQAGNWTLFVADVSGGGEYQLDSWSLAVTVIPEPGGVLGALALGALGWVILQRRGERRRREFPALTLR
jgi:subtilisin-like proprotein convertase family protein